VTVAAVWAAGLLLAIVFSLAGLTSGAVAALAGAGAAGAITALLWARSTTGLRRNLESARQAVPELT
jgi:hypothetical protein